MQAAIVKLDKIGNSYFLRLPKPMKNALKCKVYDLFFCYFDKDWRIVYEKIEDSLPKIKPDDLKARS
jgi:hypothetical protein